MRTMFATGKAAADLGIGVETPQRWDREARLKAERTGTGRRVYCKAALEDLNVCGMSKNRALAGSIRDGAGNSSTKLRCVAGASLLLIGFSRRPRRAQIAAVLNIPCCYLLVFGAVAIAQWCSA
jgi:hypothetical protein